MDRLQDISRLLLAAGGTPSRDGKTTHLTYEKEGSIRMRTWTGSELTDDELITNEVRRGTSAPIVNRSRKKVYVVHKNDSIKCFIDPLRDDDQVEEDEINDDAPWNEEEIIGVDTRVHPQSQLAVSYDKNTVFVFYQKPDGSLGGINEYNNKWKAIELPAVAALGGTPLATCNTNSAVFLFYISVDGTVRYIENSEGEWKDVFFSSAQIIDPDEKLPGTALKLTIAEDRQAFERIRPLVFCLDSNVLSIIKFRSKHVETIGIIDGIEFVPFLGNRERNRYYFWSPYPFYAMNKRNNKSQSEATKPTRLWDQYLKRSYHQEERSNPSATKHPNNPQEPFIANRRASIVINKTPATVSIETTNAKAIIPPQKSEHREISSGSLAESSIFAGFCSLTDPLNTLMGKIFRNVRNEDTIEEDASGNSRSDHRADTTDASRETNEVNVIESDGIESNGVNPGISEIDEAGPKETEVEETENAEIKADGKEADKRFIGEDESEEADSEGTEEESGSEGRASEEAETDPSEIEEEAENEEDETEEAQPKEVQTEEVQDEEIQEEEIQEEEIQEEEIRKEEIREEEIQEEEAQPKRAQEAQKNDGKPEEFEAKVSKTGESGIKGQEPRNIKCEEIRPIIAADKDEVSPAETFTTKLRLPIVESSTTERRGKELADKELGLENLDPEESERTEIPTFDKGKGPAATDTPISKKLRFNTPQDIQEDMNNHIEKIGLDSIFPKESPYTRILADNAMKLQDSKENLLNRVDDIRCITILNLYQPVLYCDDSTSMRANTRVEDQKEMVRRVTRISTSIVPPGYGTSLQFINFVRDVHDDKLSQKEVEAIMNSVKPSGHTKIGTNLKEKILKPLVYDVIKSNRKLERPILVSCITDGCPSDESVDTFRKEILKCTRFLQENGYPSSTLRFQISQIGNSSRADKFLKKLSRDKELEEVLFCTAQRLDEQFEMLRDNEEKLERWLLHTLLKPILGQEINNLNLQI
ncbi:hypothetical protein M441DRAFT_57030 [Trichoderma asperellum CBS 433.97]|uniref:VWFA domain-containing protein n=1 Tax=Trichoderma asperellum (strain ATCC 204424 / CBS 433.97 / NBRC 101777) TaxID=1042311 RepID=A0A2T3ZBS0_TRIA4|nr:hypothetical protein M441DRAFT_57030 [Trichoderma asperellum CBS 433.97]PTB42249.1 hypothetical protein M441DRAFT_57030 [Trichoderma asperellum CBS 433.97]